MKMFTLDDHSELLEFKLPEGETLYSCDSSSINNKYVAGGKKFLQRLNLHIKMSVYKHLICKDTKY